MEENKGDFIDYHKSKINSYGTEVLIQMVTWDKENISHTDFEIAKAELKLRGHDVSEYEDEYKQKTSSSNWVIPIILCFLGLYRFSKHGADSFMGGIALLLAVGWFMIAIFDHEKKTE